ncbi:MAG: MMPL family transporter [Ginsengibacter sp.]
MWPQLAKFVLKFRSPLLIALLGITVLMGYFTSKVQLSYEFARAIPVDNPKYREYLSFKEKFGDDGNMLVIAIQTDKIFELNNFKSFIELNKDLKKIKGVEEVVSMASAVNLLKNTETQTLYTLPVFNAGVSTQLQLDSSKDVFLNLPFYRTLLYNPQTNAYLIGVRINKQVLNSSGRTAVVDDIGKAANAFTKATKFATHISGLPLIRTMIASKISREMRWFLIGSLGLSTLILLLFFRSVSTTLISLSVVIIGVVWSFGILYLLGYKITLLNALTPPLLVVIGIPNCIYFLNKYHSTYRQTGDKRQSLIDMVSKMGIVTLFCNVTAAIGFAVFAFTKSAVLNEFGAVAGLSIMMIFVISFILLPAVLSYLPQPTSAQTKYLNNKWLTRFLFKLQHWVLNYKALIYAVSLGIVIFSIAGIFKLKSEGFILDDIPKTDKIYTDLKFFEKNFNGVMPLEIVVDTKKRGLLKSSLALVVFRKIDSLSQYIAEQKEMSRPLSIPEALKFARQSFYDGDTSNYLLPGESDFVVMSDYLKSKNDSNNKSSLSKILTTFMDTAKQSTRISINMADVGTKRLPEILNGITVKTNQLFDSSKYIVRLTGASITFLEGSRFIINGLEQSIFWAFLLIALCMLYLFKSIRILFCSLIPNIIPLIVTAGIMGWVGVPLKPSTVLVFSVALGIAIDVTIRFLVNYKQELANNNYNVVITVTQTIQHTGLSILYTSIVLIAGFIIFCFSGFGGTQALGWLTSVTLLVATLTNLLLLPVLLLINQKSKVKKGNA